MSEQDLFFALLRVNAAQILRYHGIAGARPSVLDAFTDIIARYLLLLGTTTREITELSNRTSSELPDARSALEHVGLLLPYTTNPDDTRAVDAFIAWAKSEEAAELRRVAGMQLQEQDDSAVLTSVVATAAGLGGGAETEVKTEVEAGAGDEEHMNMNIDMEEQKKKEKKLMIDWMTSLRQRDGRVSTIAGTTTTVTTGSEDAVDERFKGTALGPPMDVGKVVVEGGDAIKWKIGNE